MKPIEIKKLGASELRIVWDDGSASELSGEALRKGCPCAECREARGEISHSKPLSAPKTSLQIVEATIDEETHLEEIWPVGNYALGIRWGDKHDAGIYTFDVLKEIAHGS